MSEFTQPYFWLQFLCYFIITLLGVNWLAHVAWRQALRDTNPYKRRRILEKLGRANSTTRYMFVGFFHPFSNTGGGGERVLYEAIRHHQRHDDNIICVVYTGDLVPGEGSATKEEILSRVQERFNITLDHSRIAFVPLFQRKLVSDTFWRAFTLAGQAYGANRLGYEALSQLVPDVFIDTMGYAFALYPVKNYSRLIRVGAYVHYPTISTDMLRRVRQRQAGHTNASWIATSWPVSLFKYVYYQIFAACYGAALRSADVIVCNGSWTKAHIDQLLPRRIRRPWPMPPLPPVHLVYPPCDTSAFAQLPLEGRQPRWIVSVAQFRPEKEHELQLRIVRGLLDKHPELKSSSGTSRPLRLILVGSCRDERDRARLAQLRALAKELMIENHIDWHVDAPFSDVVEQMRHASIGLSTMVDEHFGIAVVESMAAGLLTLSHASAGPLQDIAVPVDNAETGFHASTLDDFVDTAYQLMVLPTEMALRVRQRARTRATTTFSAAEFEHRWRTRMWDELVPESLLIKNDQALAEQAAERQRTQQHLASPPQATPQAASPAVPEAAATIDGLKSTEGATGGEGGISTAIHTSQAAVPRQTY